MLRENVHDNPFSKWQSSDLTSDYSLHRSGAHNIRPRATLRIQGRRQGCTDMVCIVSVNHVIPAQFVEGGEENQGLILESRKEVLTTGQQGSLEN